MTRIELLAAREPTIRDIAIEALEWLQHKGPVIPESGICANLERIVQLLYSNKFEVARRMYSVVSGLCAGWRGLDDVLAFPINRVLFKNQKLKAQVRAEDANCVSIWEGVRGQLRQELIAHLLKRLKAGHRTYYTKWLNDSGKEYHEIW